MIASNIIVHRFPQAALESAFLDKCGRQFAQQRRIAIGGGLLLWVSYFVRDWSLLHAEAGNVLTEVWAIRLSGAVMIGVLLLLSRRTAFASERYAIAVMSFAVLLTWLHIQFIVLLAPGSVAFSDYYPGFSMISFVAFALFRLRVRAAASLGGACLGIFIGVGLLRYLAAADESDWIQPWISALIVLIAFYLMGLLMSAQLESAARREFIGRRKLRAEKAKTEAIGVRLRTANQRLTKLDEEKQLFLAAAYHDVQQPLSAINLFMSSARSRASVAFELGSELQMIEQMIGDIARIFDGMRDYVELGSYEPKIEPVDAGALLMQIGEQFQQAAHAKGIELRCTPQGAATPLSSDRVLLKRVLSNLVSNAVKNTSRGHVEVDCSRVGDTLRIDVRDTGVGIAREHHEAIFNEYFQVDNPGRDRSKGLGLGLAIVSRITRMLHGHRLDFESAPGRGSRFSLHVPVSNLPVVERDRHATTAVCMAGKYVIACDDEPIVLEGMRRLLAGAGAMVDVAGSGEEMEALLASAERAPNVVVMDIRLRGPSTGFELAQRLREHFSWAGAIPVAFVTGEIISPGALATVPRPYALVRKSARPERMLEAVVDLLSVSVGNAATSAVPLDR